MCIRDRLSGISSVSICKFTPTDVMRHPLVQDIVRAYDNDARERAELRTQAAGSRRNDSDEK